MGLPKLKINSVSPWTFNSIHPQLVLPNTLYQSQERVTQWTTLFQTSEPIKICWIKKLISLLLRKKLATNSKLKRPRKELLRTIKYQTLDKIKKSLTLLPTLKTLRILYNINGKCQKKLLLFRLNPM